MNVYPSPFSDSFNIEGQFRVPSSGEISITIQNILGTVLLETIAISGNDSKFSQEINFSPAPAGVYFLTVRNGKSVIIRKIVKE